MSEDKGSVAATFNLTPHTAVEQAVRMKNEIMVRIDTDRGFAYIFASPAALETLADSLVTIAAYAELPDARKDRVSLEEMERAVCDSRFRQRIELQQEGADKPA